jgi:hypothetical protein
MRGRRRIAILTMSMGALGAAIAACGAFTGDNSASGNAPDGGSGADVSVDATSIEGAVSLDAGAPDVVTPIDSGIGCFEIEGGFCATQTPKPALCADFDNPLCPLLGFSALSPNPFVAMDFDTKHPKSGTADLHFMQSTSPPQSGSWGPIASILIPKGAAPTTTLEIDLEYRVPALPPPPPGSAEHQRLGPIHLEAAGGPTVDFFIENDKSYFVINGSKYSADGPQSDLTTYRSLNFIFTMQSGGTATFTGKFEQAGSPLFTNEPLTPPLLGGQTLTMTVGYDTYILDQGEIYIDNVVARFTP